jgi:hypothetical protein
MIKYFLPLLTAFFIFACKSAKVPAIKEDIAPGWVQSTPVHPDYYIGVYSANKMAFDFRDKAKRGALENLASEISVKISSESVLKTLETEGSFNQEYEQKVKLQSTEDIEGYELMGTWENDTQYWVYYRLLKSKHAQIKKDRVEKALAMGKDYFRRSKENHNQNNYHQAFALGIKSLESVSKYLDQPLKTWVDDKEVYFATEVISYTQEMVNEIILSPSFSEFPIVIGDYLKEDDIYFLVQNKKGELLSQIPLKCQYKGVFFKNYKIHSNELGRAEISIGKIKQSQQEQFVTATLDFEELTANQTKDKTILKLLNYIPAKSVKIKLKVRPPSVFVKSNEKEFGDIKSPSILLTVKQVLNSRGLKVVNTEKEADLILLINSDTRMLGNNWGTYQVELTGTVEVVKKSNGEIVFSEVIPPTKGVQLSRVNASSDAYSKADVYVKTRLIPKLTDKYFAF